MAQTFVDSAFARNRILWAPAADTPAPTTFSRRRSFMDSDMRCRLIVLARDRGGAPQRAHAGGLTGCPIGSPMIAGERVSPSMAASRRPSGVLRRRRLIPSSCDPATLTSAASRRPEDGTDGDQLASSSDRYDLELAVGDLLARWQGGRRDAPAARTRDHQLITACDRDATSDFARGHRDNVRADHAGRSA